jgi:uncharacterized protein (TIGR03437 family)
MKTKLVKLALLSLFTLTIIFGGLAGRSVLADPDGAPVSRSGAPGETTCAASGCHSTFTLNSGTGKLQMTGLPADGYTPGQVIPITVTMTQSGIVRWGFELTVLDETGKAVGTLAVTDSTRTRLRTGTVSGGLRQYLTHTTTGNVVSTWTMRWTAPAQSAGKVTFYAAGNAANNNGGASGDYIYTTSAALSPAATLATVATISAASYASSGAVPAQSIAALFGANMAASTAVASTNPLPTTLGGIKVTVKDALGTERDAPLFFVSSAQINLLMPVGTSTGTATITVSRDGTAIGQGLLTVENVGPGLFAANANGQGVAAAVVLRVKADGSQSYEAVAGLNQAGTAFEALPIDLGPETDQVFLIAYGTGFRNRTALSNASASLGGAAAELLYVGAQGDLVGLDQANLRIPRSLTGRGGVNLALTVDGKSSNTLVLNVK